MCIISSIYSDKRSTINYFLKSYIYCTVRTRKLWNRKTTLYQSFSVFYVVRIHKAKNVNTSLIKLNGSVYNTTQVLYVSHMNWTISSLNLSPKVIIPLLSCLVPIIELSGSHYWVVWFSLYRPRKCFAFLLKN